jgi:hypothetical protein
MKMPHHPFYPSSQSPDIFGLGYPSILGQAGEAPADTQKRIAMVEAGVIAAFEAAIRHLGDEEARRLFSRVVRRPRRGRGKMLDPHRDIRLLREYDTATGKGETVAALARRLHAQGRGLGATAEAVGAQIRKLVKERKKREDAGRVQARRWRMAMRGETSLLSAARSEK